MAAVMTPLPEFNPDHLYLFRGDALLTQVRLVEVNENGGLRAVTFDVRPEDLATIERDPSDLALFEVVNRATPDARKLICLLTWGQAKNTGRCLSFDRHQEVAPVPLGRLRSLGTMDTSFPPPKGYQKRGAGRKREKR